MFIQSESESTGKFHHESYRCGREARIAPAQSVADRRQSLQCPQIHRTQDRGRKASRSSERTRRGLLPEDLERQLRARGEDLNEFRRLRRDLIGIFEPRDHAGACVVTGMALTWWEKARRIRQWVAAGLAALG
jgi:hypothetical protein